MIADPKISADFKSAHNIVSDLLGDVTMNGHNSLRNYINERLTIVQDKVGKLRDVNERMLTLKNEYIDIIETAKYW